MQVTKEEISNLYNDQGLSDRQIALKLGCTDVSVGNLRKRMGIPTLSQDARRVLSGKPSLKELTEHELRRLYHDEKLAYPKIAEIYGVESPAIKKLAKRFGIQAILKSDRTTEPLTREQKEIIIGTLLGDGCIGYEKRGETSRFHISHSSKQYTYLRKTAKELGSLVSRVSPSSKILKNGKKVFAHTIVSFYHKELRKFRKVFYRDNLKGEHPDDWLKAPPRDIFRKLPVRSLAYWYFDDGTFGDNLPSIVVHFPLLDIDQLVEDLNYGTGLSWYKTQYGGGHLYSLKLRSECRKAFFDSIVEFASPDLMYKFPESYWDSIKGSILFSPNLTENDEDKLKQYHAPNWKKLALEPGGVEKQKLWVDEVFQIYRNIGFPYCPIPGPDEIIRTVSNLQKRDEIVNDRHVFIRSNSGMSLCNSFMPHRYETCVNGNTALGTFLDDDAFRKVIHTQFSARNSKDVIPTRMRGVLSVYGGNRTPSNFRPSITKAILDALCPQGGTYWDPCAGFGGRLLGAMASNKNVNYICTEPSPQTVRSLRDLWRNLYTAMDWSPSRVRIVEGVAEHDCPSEDSVDVVFTSPPYYSTEEYKGGKQSFKYGSYESWVNSFLKPMIQNSFNCLKSGGYMAINIQDVTRGGVKYGLVSKLHEIAMELGFTPYQRYWMPLGRMGVQRPDEPILVYKKCDDSSPNLWDIEEVSITELKKEAVLDSESVEAWDLGEVHTTPRSDETPFDGICEICKVSLSEYSAKKKYCDTCKLELEAEKARKKRIENRFSNPVKTYRVALCKVCSKEMKIPLEGGVPTQCDTCRKVTNDARRDLGRTKICPYRHCKREFHDDTPNKKLKFCHVEHRRREKLFRNGQAKSLDHFLKPDPVLEAGKEVEVKTRNCLVCKEPYVREAKETRCKPCREALRQKECRQCGAGYVDRSEKNTRRKCDSCQK